MTASTERPPDALPRAMPALWRTFQLGYRAEPRLLLASLATTVLTMLPDALLALWLKLLTDGVIEGSRSKVLWAAVGLGVSVTATWYVSVVNERLSRRFRDRIAIAMESHIARLQATVGHGRAPGAPRVPRPPRRAARHSRSRSTTSSSRCWRTWRSSCGSW